MSQKIKIVKPKIQHLKQVIFDNCLLRNADLYECTLNKVHFEQCDLNEVNFSRTLLKGIDISSSTFQRLIVALGDVNGCIVSSDKRLDSPRCSG